jgi:hypothetical protein
VPASWSAKDERQYEHILSSCRRKRRSTRTCKRIAAATVNKQRASEGRTLRGLAGEEERWTAAQNKAYTKAYDRCQEDIHEPGFRPVSRAFCDDVSSRVAKGSSYSKAMKNAPSGLSGLGDAATRRAMRDNPDYWLGWYTFKSLALVGAVGVIGYLIGKEA